MSILKKFKTHVLSVDNTKKIFVLSFLIILVVFSIFPSFNKKAEAVANAVTGWAWSGNTGWISFNCANTSCSTTNYKVNIDSVTGTMTGYAWSSNIGWIKFGGLSSFPTGPGTTATDAKLVGNNITGWARACGGLTAVSNPQINQASANNACTGISRTDGWDGWISLSGTNYGVTVDPVTGAMTGYAWGSDVLGWIQFKASTVPLVVVPVPSLTMLVNELSGEFTVDSGTSVRLSSIGSLLKPNSYIPVTATLLKVDGSLTAETVGNWTGIKPCPTSTEMQTAYPSPFILVNNTPSPQVHIFSLTCTIAETGNQISSTVKVTVKPAVVPVDPSVLLILKASTSTTPAANTITINSGEVVTLAATGHDLNDWSGTATVESGTPANPSWTGYPNCPNPGPTTLTYAPPFALVNTTPTVKTYKYTLQCYDLGDSPVYSTVTIYVKPPTLVVKANGVAGPGNILTVNSGDYVTLSAEGTILKTTALCTASSTPAGLWSGSKSVPDPFQTYLPPVTPAIQLNNTTALPVTKTLTLSCTRLDNNGPISNYVKVTVLPPPPPTATLKAYHDEAFLNPITTSFPEAGGKVVLKWTSTNASVCGGSNLPSPLDYSGWSGVSQIPVFGGSKVLDPVTTTTTFKLICAGPTGSVTVYAPVQVGVDPGDGPPPLCPGIPDCPKKQPFFIEQ